jgi:hypothetical protein
MTSKVIADAIPGPTRKGDGFAVDDVVSQPELHAGVETERLRALRLAKEAADKVLGPMPQSE